MSCDSCEFWIVAGDSAGAENEADRVDWSRKVQISCESVSALNLVLIPSSTVWAYGTTSDGTVPLSLTERARARERERRGEG